MQHLNILVGSLETLHVGSLYECQSLLCAPDSDRIAQSVDDTASSLGISRNSFCRLLSDAAKYVVAACAILKSLCTKLFHVTRVAHLLYNCATKVKSTLKLLIG